MPLIREIYQASDFHKSMTEISSFFYEKRGRQIERQFLCCSAVSLIFLFVSIYSLFYIQDGRSILPLMNMVLSIAAPFCGVYMLTNLAMVSPFQKGNTSRFEDAEFFLAAILFNWGKPAMRMRLYFLLASLNLFISMHLMSLLGGGPGFG